MKRRLQKSGNTDRSVLHTQKPNNHLICPSSFLFEHLWGEMSDEEGICGGVGGRKITGENTCDDVREIEGRRKRKE